jgi:hypothetical protein
VFSVRKPGFTVKPDCKMKCTSGREALSCQRQLWALARVLTVCCPEIVLIEMATDLLLLQERQSESAAAVACEQMRARGMLVLPLPLQFEFGIHSA